MKTVALPLFLGLTSLFLLHCAEGSTFDGVPVDEEEEATGSGNGSSSSGNTAGGAGGKPGSSSSGGGAEGGTGGSGSASSSVSSSSGASSSSSSASSSSSSASSSASSSSSSSSSSGAPCNPTNPGAVCMSNQHCLPQPDGMPICEGPVGSGSQYSICTTNAQCLPAYACIDTGGSTACCLDWCTNDFDCGIFDSCIFLLTPVYVGSTEYGVCSDSFGCF